MSDHTTPPTGSRWAIVSLSVSILLGVLALLAAVGGLIAVFQLPGLGVGLLIAAAILAVLAFSSMRSYRVLIGERP